MRTLASYMPFNILCEAMQSGEVCLYDGRYVRVIGLRPESGMEDIKDWLVMFRDKYGELQEIYLKTK